MVSFVFSCCCELPWYVYCFHPANVLIYDCQSIIRFWAWSLEIRILRKKFAINDALLEKTLSDSFIAPSDSDQRLFQKSFIICITSAYFRTVDSVNQIPEGGQDVGDREQPTQRP